MRSKDVKYDCSHFEGHIPCKPNKQFDVQCDNCSHYGKDTSSIINLDTQKALLKEIYNICDFTTKNGAFKKPIISASVTRILFIKLGAIGDVIRTTPLIEKYKNEYGDCHFSWITHSPQVVPKDKVDLVYKWNEASGVNIVAQSIPCFHPTI